jgi:hypothetical protein
MLKIKSLEKRTIRRKAATQAGFNNRLRCRDEKTMRA